MGQARGEVDFAEGPVAGRSTLPYNHIAFAPAGLYVVFNNPRQPHI
jgi:hypothetical protein